MAKNKKATSNSSSYGKKKAASSTSKKPVKRAVDKLDDKKVEIISEKITRINHNFKSLIADCQNALKQLTLSQIE